ncbi:MAG: glutaminase [Bacteroidales bacterium]|jgi:glutaminase|nr:glutaminase [Bacteroidales bacterium]
MENYQEIIEEIYHEIRPLTHKGRVADYIPALARVSSEKLGISVSTINGQTYHVGDVEEKFSIQSISKVFSLSLAIGKMDENIWTRIGREPSGNAFNSLVQLEYEHGIPRNPFVNAGALVVTDILISNLKDPYSDYLDFVRSLCVSGDVGYNTEVARSEKETGFTNAAMVNFLRSHKNIKNDVNQVLDVYYHHCSIDMTLKELSLSFLYLSNHGVVPCSNQRVLTRSQAKRINALMLTCGTYDEAGDFAYLAGIPAKSGVGGGIAAIIPNRLSIAVWSPALNKKGNSLAGVKALELFTTKTGMSIF